MAELIKKQIVTEVMYLAEGGAIAITHDPDNMFSQRYKAAAANIVAYGSSERVAIRNFKQKVSQQISANEVNINISKTNTKRYVNKLRNLRSIYHEVKTYEKKSG